MWSRRFRFTSEPHGELPTLRDVADFCIRHRRLTVLAWVVALLAAGAAAERRRRELLDQLPAPRLRLDEGAEPARGPLPGSVGRSDPGRLRRRGRPRAGGDQAADRRPRRRAGEPRSRRLGHLALRAAGSDLQERDDRLRDRRPSTAPPSSCRSRRSRRSPTPPTRRAATASRSRPAATRCARSSSSSEGGSEIIGLLAAIVVLLITFGSRRRDEHADRDRDRRSRHRAQPGHARHPRHRHRRFRAGAGEHDRARRRHRLRAVRRDAGSGRAAPTASTSRAVVARDGYGRPRGPLRRDHGRHRDARAVRDRRQLPACAGARGVARRAADDAGGADAAAGAALARSATTDRPPAGPAKRSKAGRRELALDALEPLHPAPPVASPRSPPAAC